MKLSYRDKIIFIVVIVIVILIAGFFLLIRPKFQEIDTAKANYEAKKQEQEEIDAKISTLPQLIENIKSVAKEIGEEQELFMTEQDPYLNEIYVREALESTGVEYKSISTTYATAGPITRYTVTPANLLAYDTKMNTDLYHELPQEVYDLYLETAPAGYPEATIGITSMELTFYGDKDLEDAYNVIDKLSQDEKTVILNSISSGDDTAETEGETRTEFTCVITVYSVYPLNVDKVMEEDGDWQQYIGQTPVTDETAAQ